MIIARSFIILRRRNPSAQLESAYSAFLPSYPTLLHRTECLIPLFRPSSLVNAGLDSAEVALVGTVVPRDSDEALTLFPTLQSKDIANIDIALNEINNQKDALG
jgi:hypothetical protein